LFDFYYLLLSNKYQGSETKQILIYDIDDGDLIIFISLVIAFDFNQMIFVLEGKVMRLFIMKYLSSFIDMI